jgi:anti-sigma factor RsiW
MIDCSNTEMRDALPDVIHGGLDAAKLAEVEAHVASCAQCAAELALLRAAVSTRPDAPPINVQRIVSALPVAAKNGLLLHRGRGEPESAVSSTVQRPRSIWTRPALRIAAAVAIVSAGALSLLVGREVTNPEVQAGRNTSASAPENTAPAAPQAVAVAPTSPAQQVQPSPSPVRSSPVTGIGAGLLMSEVQQLSDEHLVALLSEIDDIDAVPLSEPETIAPALTVSDTIGSSE